MNVSMQTPSKSGNKQKSDNLCLLIELFSSFTFKVIFDIYRFYKIDKQIIKLIINFFLLDKNKNKNKNKYYDPSI